MYFLRQISGDVPAIEEISQKVLFDSQEVVKGSPGTNKQVQLVFQDSLVTNLFNLNDSTTNVTSI